MLGSGLGVGGVMLNGIMGEEEEEVREEESNEEGAFCLSR